MAFVTGASKYKLDLKSNRNPTVCDRYAIFCVPNTRSGHTTTTVVFWKLVVTLTADRYTVFMK
jgi:hypothetical protein